MLARLVAPGRDTNPEKGKGAGEEGIGQDEGEGEQPWPPGQEPFWMRAE